jgi:hypothetical protein
VKKVITPDATVRSIFVPQAGWNYNFRNPGARSISPNILREEEFILHPETKYKVKSIKKKKDKEGEYYEITMTASGSL